MYSGTLPPSSLPSSSLLRSRLLGRWLPLGRRLLRHFLPRALLLVSLLEGQLDRTRQLRRDLLEGTAQLGAGLLKREGQLGV